MPRAGHGCAQVHAITSQHRRHTIDDEASRVSGNDRSRRTAGVDLLVVSDKAPTDASDHVCRLQLAECHLVKLGPGLCIDL